MKNGNRRINMKITSFLFILFVLTATNCKKSETNNVSDASNANVEVKGTPKAINKETSTIKWVGKKVTGSHNGTVKIKDGTVYLDGNSLTGGKFTIDMGTIVNLDLEGEWKEKLEGHLRDTDFFEISKFPVVEFVITQVSPKDANNVDITGNVSIKGITKSITFPATIVSENNEPKSANAKFSFDRQIFGITFKGKADDLISDTVDVELNVSL
jgi:polyisoprenoid-binding protein YceI